MNINYEDLKKEIKNLDILYEEHWNLKHEHLTLKSKYRGILYALKNTKADCNSKSEKRTQQKPNISQFDYETLLVEKNKFKTDYFNLQKEYNEYINNAEIRYQKAYKETEHVNEKLVALGAEKQLLENDNKDLKNKINILGKKIKSVGGNVLEYDSDLDSDYTSSNTPNNKNLKKNQKLLANKVKEWEMKYANTEEELLQLKTENKMLLESLKEQNHSPIIDNGDIIINNIDTDDGTHDSDLLHDHNEHEILFSSTLGKPVRIIENSDLSDVDDETFKSALNLVHCPQLLTPISSPVIYSNLHNSDVTTCMRNSNLHQVISNDNPCTKISICTQTDNINLQKDINFSLIQNDKFLSKSSQNQSQKVNINILGNVKLKTPKVNKRNHVLILGSTKKNLYYVKKYLTRSKHIRQNRKLRSRLKRSMERRQKYKSNNVDEVNVNDNIDLFDEHITRSVDSGYIKTDSDYEGDMSSIMESDKSFNLRNEKNKMCENHKQNRKEVCLENTTQAPKNNCENKLGITNTQLHEESDSSISKSVEGKSTLYQNKLTEPTSQFNAGSSNENKISKTFCEEVCSKKLLITNEVFSSSSDHIAIERLLNIINSNLSSLQSFKEYLENKSKTNAYYDTTGTEDSMHSSHIESSKTDKLQNKYNFNRSSDDNSFARHIEPNTETVTTIRKGIKRSIMSDISSNNVKTAKKDFINLDVDYIISNSHNKNEHTVLGFSENDKETKFEEYRNRTNSCLRRVYKNLINLQTNCIEQLEIKHKTLLISTVKSTNGLQKVEVRNAPDNLTESIQEPYPIVNTEFLCGGENGLELNVKSSNLIESIVNSQELDNEQTIRTNSHLVNTPETLLECNKKQNLNKSNTNSSNISNNGIKQYSTLVVTKRKPSKLSKLRSKIAKLCNLQIEPKFIQNSMQKTCILTSEKTKKNRTCNEIPINETLQIDFTQNHKQLSIVSTLEKKNITDCQSKPLQTPNNRKKTYQESILDLFGSNSDISSDEESTDPIKLKGEGEDCIKDIDKPKLHLKAEKLLNNKSLNTLRLEDENQPLKEPMEEMTLGFTNKSVIITIQKLKPLNKKVVTPTIKKKLYFSCLICTQFNLKNTTNLNLNLNTKRTGDSITTNAECASKQKHLLTTSTKEPIETNSVTSITEKITSKLTFSKLKSMKQLNIKQSTEYSSTNSDFHEEDCVRIQSTNSKQISDQKVVMDIMNQTSLTEKQMEKRLKAAQILTSTLTKPGDPVKPFKKPVRKKLSQSIDTPQSPKKSIEIESYVPPVIIPLQNLKCISIVKGNQLIDELMQFRGDNVRLGSVAKAFAGQKSEFIAELILRRILKDVGDSLIERKYAREPVMTATQEILLKLMVTLEKQGCRDLFDAYFKKAEKYLSNVTSAEAISSVTRLYVAICKLQSNYWKIRKTLCEAFLTMGDLACIFLLLVLQSWPEVLPLKDTPAQNQLLTRGIIQLVLFTSCKLPNLLHLRQLLLKFYGYSFDGEDPKKLFLELLESFIEEGNTCALLLSLALSKHLGKSEVFDLINLKTKPSEMNYVHRLSHIISVIKHFTKLSIKQLDSETLANNRNWLKQLCSESYPEHLRKEAFAALEWL